MVYTKIFQRFNMFNCILYAGTVYMYFQASFKFLFFTNSSIFRRLKVNIMLVFRASKQ